MTESAGTAGLADDISIKTITVLNIMKFSNYNFSKIIHNLNIKMRFKYKVSQLNVYE